MTAIACLALIQQSPCTAAIAVSHVQVRAGDTFEAVVRLDTQDEWHVYWSNPGDSGTAPTVKWILPKGVTVTGPEFPVPTVHLDESGTTFNFEKSLSMVYRMKVDKGFKGNSVKLAGHADWLVCKSQCLPGSADLEANVSIGDEPATSPDSDAVKAAVEALPKTSTDVTVSATKDGIQVGWKTGAPRSDLTPYFLPSEESSFDFKSQVWSFSSGVATGLVKVHPDSTSKPKRLRGLLYWGDPSSHNPEAKFAVNIDVPTP